LIGTSKHVDLYGINVYRMYRDRIRDFTIRQHILSVQIPDVEVKSVNCISISFFLFAIQCHYRNEVRNQYLQPTKIGQKK